MAAARLFILNVILVLFQVYTSSSQRPFFPQQQNFNQHEVIVIDQFGNLQFIPSQQQFQSFQFFQPPPQFDTFFFEEFPGQDPFFFENQRFPQQRPRFPQQQQQQPPRFPQQQQPPRFPQQQPTRLPQQPPQPPRNRPEPPTPSPVILPPPSPSPALQAPPPPPTTQTPPRPARETTTPPKAEGLMKNQNDFEETKAIVIKARKDIATFFEKAIADIQKTGGENQSVADDIRQTIRSLAEQGTKSFAFGDNRANASQCLKNVETETKKTIKDNSEAGMKCVNDALERGKMTRNEALRAAQNDMAEAKDHNDMDSENLSLCASSQFELCVDEREALRKFVLAAEQAAMVDTKHATDSIEKERTQLNQCKLDAEEDFEDMLTDIEKAFELCQKRA